MDGFPCSAHLVTGDGGVEIQMKEIESTATMTASAAQRAREI